MILILGTYPAPVRVLEGSMSRVAAIDRIFASKDRIYVSFNSSALFHEQQTPVRHENGILEYNLNPAHSSHYNLLRSLVLRAQLVYCTALQYAKFAIPFLRAGNVVVDIHGVAPEEERLCERPGQAEYYEAIEAEIMDCCRNLVVVSDAMKEHLLHKYTATRANCIVAPIFEEAFRALPKEAALRRRSGNIVLYSGGLHAWQNIEMMLDAVKLKSDAFEFRFLTHERDLLAKMCEANGIADKVSIKFVPKAQLAEHYLAADYGLILRDDTTVNRVACPTKLGEYLLAGVIPIVLSPDLGDFRACGYCFVTLSDFMAGKLPDETEKAAMRVRNRECMAALGDSFEEARIQILELARHTPPRESPASFLTAYERNVLYPATARLTLYRSDSARVVSLDLAGPYDELEFNVSSREPSGRLEIVPIGCASCFSIDRLEVWDVHGIPVNFTLTGNFSAVSPRGITAYRNPVCLSLILRSPSVIAKVKVCVKFLLLGHEVCHLGRAREFWKKRKWAHILYCKLARPLFRRLA